MPQADPEVGLDGVATRQLGGVPQPLLVVLELGEGTPTRSYAPLRVQPKVSASSVYDQSSSRRRRQASRWWSVSSGPYTSSSLWR